MEAENPFRYHESAKPDEDDEHSEREKKKKRVKQQAKEAREESDSAEKTSKKTEEDKASLFEVLFADEAPDKKQHKKAESSREEAEDKSDEAADEAVEKEVSSELTEAERRAAAITYIERRQQELVRASETKEAAEQEADTAGNVEEEADLPVDIEQEAAVSANRTFLQRLADKLRRTEQPLGEAMYQTAAAEAIAAATPSRTTEAEPDVAEPPEDSSRLLQDQEATQDEAAFSSSHRPANEASPATVVESQDLHRDERPEPASSVTGGGASYRAGPGGAGQRFTPKPEAAVPPRETYRYEKPTGAGEVLLGGVIGYLFGRHRGRRQERAEHKPAHQALEQEVDRLEETIQSYEQVVRNTVGRHEREEQRHERTPAVPPQLSSPEAATTLHQSQHEQTPEHVSRRPAVVDSKGSPEDTLLSDKPEQPPASRPELVSQQSKAEMISTAPLQEVLSVAREIHSPDGKRLNDLFEQKRFDEPALREIVKAYTRGENYQKLLDRLIVPSLETQAAKPEILQSSRAPTEARSAVAVPQQSQLPPAPADNPLPAPYLYTTNSSDTTPPADSRHGVGQTSPLRQLGLGILAGLGVVGIAVIIILFIV